MRLRTASLRGCVVVVLCLAACGGGGSGGGGGPVAPFSGAYRYAGIHAHAVPGFDSSSQWAQIQALVAGQFDIDGRRNDLGVVGDEVQTGVPYTVDPDGTFDVFDPGAPAERTAQGRLRGSLAILGVPLAGVDPALHLVAAQSGVWSDASLAGTWSGCFWSVNVGFVTSLMLTFTFDGAANGTYEGASNTNGLVFPVAAAPAQYDVDSDGRVDLDIQGSSLLLRGGIDPSGRVVVLGGGVAAGQPPTFGVLVKNEAGGGFDLLTGTYFVAGIRFHAAGPAFTSVTGPFVADGLGDLTTALTTNTEGAVVTFPPADATYTINATGVLQVNVPGATLRGGVTHDGGFAALAGGLGAGSDPAIYVLLRE